MRKTVLTLGTFDGVHKGHQALVRKVVRPSPRFARAERHFILWNAARHAGEPSAKPVLLTTLEEKLRAPNVLVSIPSRC